MSCALPPFSKQEHECLVEGPLNNLKQSMVQFQKPKKVGIKLLQCVGLCTSHPGLWQSTVNGFTRVFFWVVFLMRHVFINNNNVTYQYNTSSCFVQIYNERRLFYGGGPGIAANDNFGSGAGTSSDRRSGRGRGM